MGMTNDPISDMLTRIRNASAVNKPEVMMPYSKMKHRIAEILSQEGYVGKVSKVEPDADKPGAGRFAELRIGLRYNEKTPLIRTLKRVSKPGLRVYKGADQLPVILNNLGIALVSTSQGVMTNKEAKKRGIGGEVICEVY
jgi:small subunit ribosomal protein S8